jgi:succinyl-CoA synthetase beta subunit
VTSTILDEEIVDDIVEKMNLPDVRNIDYIVRTMYEVFSRSDLTLLEINPLGVTTDHQMILCDAKLNFDSNAAYR